MIRLRIDGRTFLEKILACALTGTDGIVLCKHGGTSGPYIHIIDMGGNNADTACAFMDSNVFVIGLTWNSPERLWLADEAPSFDAINFRPLQMPFPINDLIEVIRDMHGAWNPIYCHAGMNLWQFTIDFINSKGSAIFPEAVKEAIFKKYPAIKNCLDNTKLVEKLALHVALDFHKGLAHRNVEDGLEGVLSDIASFAADSELRTQDVLNRFLEGLNQYLAEFERYNFYLSELENINYSEGALVDFISELKEKQKVLFERLTRLSKKVAEESDQQTLILETTIESIESLKKLLSFRREMKELYGKN